MFTFARRALIVYGHDHLKPVEGLTKDLGLQIRPSSQHELKYPEKDTFEWSVPPFDSEVT